MPHPYCSEFEALFESNTIERLSRIFGIDINNLREELTNNLEGSTFTTSIYANSQKYRTPLGPFHLGLGNPNAQILFVGKELGINTNDPNPPQLTSTVCGVGNYYQSLYVNEAILNYFLWALKVKGLNIMPNCFFQDPEFASTFCHLYNTETKKRSGHYWRYINKVVSASLGYDLNFNTQTFGNSFFNYAFLTELNNIPSSKTINPPSVSTVRDKFNDLTSIPFFKKFKYIVFSCRTYLRDNIPNYNQEIERLYDVTVLPTFEPTKNIREVYESSSQRIIVCSNLAGAAGWSNEELGRLGGLLS